MAVLFLSKAVRDLHWVLASPHLLTHQAGVPCCDDAWCAAIVAESLPWLLGLDADPTPLEDWLCRQRNVRRLGFYYAALLEFWVRHCPARALSTPTRAVLVQQQIHAGLAGEVAGQLKLVFTRRAVSEAAQEEVVHWESHVKFFAWCAPTDEPLFTTRVPDVHGSAHSSVNGAVAPSPCDADEERRVEAGLAQYVGPFLGENLLHRVVELRRKVSISQGPSVQAFVRDHFARASDAATAPHAAPKDDGNTSSSRPTRHGGSDTTARRIVAETVVRGWLFYPLGSDHAVAAREASAHAGVSSHHGRGWWSRSLEAVLAHHPQESLWALPGSGAGVREDATGGVGGKLHWMAPAVAVANANGSGYAIRGIEAIGVADCPLMSADELVEAIDGAQRPESQISLPPSSAPAPSPSSAPSPSPLSALRRSQL